MSDPLPPTVAQADGVPIVLPPNADAPGFHPPAEPGDLGRLAGYRVLKLLGRGGMGAVYLALDEGLQRQVALKVMLPRYAINADARERFRREARAAAKVDHENVVTVYQVGEDCGTTFLAMELLIGSPLDRYLKRKGRLTVPQALRVGSEVAQGLAAAHKLGLIHRDIKPANLWIEASHLGRIKILDFGLAKPLAGPEAVPGDHTELTGSGAVMGTPAYMSPEQARGEPLDGRSDLFSLGVVLYQLTTGKRPFDRPTAMASTIALATETPVPVRTLNPDVPEAFDAVILSLLAKDKNARPQSAAEVARRLRELERGMVMADHEVSVASAAPQVIYVPIHVTALPPGENEFANLTSPSDPTAADQRAEKPTEQQPAAPRVRSRFPWWIVAASAALVAVSIGAVAYFGQRKPNPIATSTESEEDKKREEERRKEEERKREEARRKEEERKKALRAFAKWVFEKGGTVDAAPLEDIKDLNSLPNGAVVTSVRFGEKGHRLTDADVEKFRDCLDLKKLDCGENALTDVGFKALLALPFARQLQSLSLPDLKVSPAALAELAKCRDLRTLNLTRAPLSGSLKFVAELPELQSLNAAATGLTDEDLVALKGTKLLGLLIPSNLQVTDAGLEHLTALQNLTVLDISRTKLTGRSAATVAKFSKLTHLTANDLQWADDDIAPIGQMPALQYLHLSGSPITDRGVEFLCALSQPAILILNKTQITDTGLALLHNKKSLGEIHLGGTKVTLAGVKALQDAVPACNVVFDYDPKADRDRQLADWIFVRGGSVTVIGRPTVIKNAAGLPAGSLRVTEVVLPDTAPPVTDADLDLFRDTGVTMLALGAPNDITDAALEKFSRLPSAERILLFRITSRRLTGDGYAHLARLKNLEVLDLTESVIDDDGMAVCRALPKLKWLGLKGTKVTDKGVVHLTGLGLTHLDLPDTAVGDGAAMIAGGIPSLVRLDLQRTKVTDTGLKHIGGLKRLRLLYLNGTAVTDEGMKHLANVPTLAQLDLSSTEITDAAAKHLAQIQTLTQLYLRESKLTSDGATALRTALPKCRVTHEPVKP